MPYIIVDVYWTTDITTSTIIWIHTQKIPNKLEKTNSTTKKYASHSIKPTFQFKLLAYKNKRNPEQIRRSRNLRTKIYTKKKNLGAALSTVGAADEFDVAAAMLVAPTVPSLECLQQWKT